MKSKSQPKFSKLANEIAKLIQDNHKGGTKEEASEPQDNAQEEAAEMTSGKPSESCPSCGHKLK